MKDLIKDRPHYENARRHELSADRRIVATRFAERYAAVPTEVNSDEAELKEEGFCASFTKGLPHNEFALLEDNLDYVRLVNHINEQDAQDFDKIARGIHDMREANTRRKENAAGDARIIEWRGWESPRAGHYFDLQGPDADAVSMPPAPALGSEELTAEMAEVYALALLRDIPFSQISDVSGEEMSTGISVSSVLNALGQLSWFAEVPGVGLNTQERRRRAARKTEHGADFDINNPPDAGAFDAALAFRGSAPGARVGPYVSQFMLLGNNMRSDDRTKSSIQYGRQVIDQKVETFKPGRDYMIHWKAYLDVQNGADFGADNNVALDTERRFIATPRDLAAYVRYDQLYQGYLNACLYMLGDKRFGFQKPVLHPHTNKPGPGFPDGQRTDPNSPPSRQAFATFGGPHILTMVTEVATRCLKAVRRQKFNYHRRARPERIGALLTLKGTQGNKGKDNDVSSQLGGTTAGHLATMLNSSSFRTLLSLVNSHNQSRLASADGADAHLDFSSVTDPDWFRQADNYLLPMAYAEGSPMHPSYGAGHATVAGGCVTMLKAFFNTTDEQGKAVPWPEGVPVLQANADGSELEDFTGNVGPGLTIGGELNKLAANISIARNMAGVHYYTDYYESLRMGERITTGILIEQMKQYNEPVEFSFESFDGDHVHLLKNDYDYSDPRVFIQDSKGNDIDIDTWWHRHSATEDDSVAIQFASEDSKAGTKTSTTV